MRNKAVLVELVGVMVDMELDEMKEVVVVEFLVVVVW